MTLFVVLVIIGAFVCFLLSAGSVSFGRFVPGWFGLALVAVLLLIQTLADAGVKAGP